MSDSPLSSHPKFNPPKFDPKEFNKRVITEQKKRHRQRARRKFALGSLALAAASLVAAPFIWAPTILASEVTQNAKNELVHHDPNSRYASTLEEAIQSVWRLKTNQGHGSGSVVSCVVEREASTVTIKNPDGSTTVIEVPRRYRILLLTANHVVDHLELRESDPNLYATNYDSTEILTNGAVVYRHPYKDAALVSFLSYKYCLPIRRESALPKLGQKVVSVGYGGAAGHIWISDGRYSGISRATYYSVPGDSGGAVLTPHGTLLGVIQAIEVVQFRWSPFPTALYKHCKFAEVVDLSDWLANSIAESLVEPHPPVIKPKKPSKPKSPKPKKERKPVAPK